MTVKDIPVTVILACVVLLAFVAVTVYLHPAVCLAFAIGALICASGIRVAYFVIEGE